MKTLLRFWRFDFDTKSSETYLSRILRPEDSEVKARKSRFTGDRTSSNVVERQSFAGQKKLFEWLAVGAEG